MRYKVTKRKTGFLYKETVQKSHNTTLRRDPLYLGIVGFLHVLMYENVQFPYKESKHRLVMKRK